MTAKMFFALVSIFFDYFAAISRVRWSIEARPIVKPDINPEMVKSVKLTPISTHQAAENGASRGRSSLSQSESS